MIAFDSHAGFTFSNVKLQVTEITNRQNQFFITNLDEIYFNDEIDFTKDKETKITSLFQTAFEELLIKNSITSNAVSFSLPQELFITAQLPFEKTLLHSDLIKEFRWQLSLLHPYLNWNDYVIRFHEVDRRFTGANDVALVFALNRKHINFITNFCRKNYLKPKFIDHCHLAANNLIITDSSAKAEKLLSFYISEKILSVVISDNSSLIHYEDIPITNIQEIRNLITDVLNKIINLKLDQAYLFGNTISHSAAQILSETTGIDFVIMNPFTKLKADLRLMTNKFYTESNHLFSASAGTAVRV